MNKLVLAALALGLATLFFGWLRPMGSTGQPIKTKEMVSANAQLETAVFAGGCFWCVESDFEKYDGIVEAVSGYTGGHVENPTYRQVCTHNTGHLEAVEVTYDANKVDYNDLLEIFWRSIDPTDAGGQFADQGESYTTAIFVENETQRELAEQSKQRLNDSGRFAGPVVTTIRDAATFYPAEDYHQDYYATNSFHYNSYRFGSGRDRFIKSKWGDDAKYTIPAKQMIAQGEGWSDQPNPGYEKPADEQLQNRLTKIQYNVTQHEGTEYSFNNEYHDEKRDGIYVDIVSGEPLFGSVHKFDSGTGWPSFDLSLIHI